MASAAFPACQACLSHQCAADVLRFNLLSISPLVSGILKQANSIGTIQLKGKLGVPRSVLGWVDRGWMNCLYPDLLSQYVCRHALNSGALAESGHHRLS